jgi:hypothetical protein
MQWAKNLIDSAFIKILAKVSIDIELNTYVFLRFFHFTLFWSDTRHCALMRIRVTPAWPYLALVCSGVSPYWKKK